MSERVADVGLKIKEDDWFEPEGKHEPVNFLDISFSFDNSRCLQTDLYCKPTDARSYLNFNSAHPNYTFSGIVHSQAVRIRRIVNNDSRLANRLDELLLDFRKCGYPMTMLTNIMEKVKAQERCLTKKDTDKPPGEDKIMVISTFGRDKKLIDVVEKVQSEKFKFQFVKKTAASFRNLLVKSKTIALGTSLGSTTPCDNPRCHSCHLMSNSDYIEGPTGKRVKTAKGNCISRNVLYCTMPNVVVVKRGM